MPEKERNEAYIVFESLSSGKVNSVGMRTVGTLVHKAGILSREEIGRSLRALATRTVTIIVAILFLIGTAEASLAQPPEEPPGFGFGCNEDCKQCKEGFKCIVDILFGIIPEVSVVTGLCQFEGDCKALCAEIRKDISALVLIKETVSKDFCDITSAAVSFAADVESGALGFFTEALGCVFGCLGDDPKLLKDFCSDLGEVEMVVDAVDEACLALDILAVDATISSGSAGRIEQGSRTSEITLSGKFTFAENINLGDAKVTILDLLNEEQGNRELIRDETGEQIVPFIFPPIGLITTNSPLIVQRVVYETPTNLSAFSQVMIERSERNPDLYEFTLDASRVEIENPALCKGNPAVTEITTGFKIEDGMSPPIIVRATGMWECLSLDPVELSIKSASGTGGGSCALAPADSKEIPLPAYLLLLLTAIVLRLRRRNR